MNIDRKYIIALFPILILGVVFYYFSDIVTYIALAWVVSMVGAPLMSFFMKFLGRSLSAALTLFTFTLLSILLVWVFVPSIVNQAKNLAGIDYERVVSSFEEPLNDWNEWLVDKGLVQGEVEEVEIDTLPEVEEGESILTEIVRVDSLLLNPKDSTQASSIAFVFNIDPNRLNGQNEESDSKEVLHTDDFSERVRKSLFSFLDPSRISGIFSSIVGVLGNFFVGIMSIFFIAFFFLREQGLFYNMISAIVPNDHEGHVSLALTETSKMLIRYFVGVALQIVVITIIVSLALRLLGIENALLIGFFAALMNVIPYIGPIIGASFGVIITIATYAGSLQTGNPEVAMAAGDFYSDLLPMILKVLAVFMGMQLFDNFIVQPNIFSKSVKAHPLEIFIIVLVGAKLGGIIGMVLAIPVYTVLRVLASVFLSEYKIVQRMTASLQDEEVEVDEKNEEIHTDNDDSDPSVLS